jgi:quinol monooxygenase YgiN
MMAFVVAATWTARPGEEDAVAGALARLTPGSRAEPGMLLYQPHRDPADPRVFFLYEQYADRAAYDAHTASQHFERHALGDAIPRLERRERVYYETWDP